jgi:hypothetical protein
MHHCLESVRKTDRLCDENIGPSCTFGGKVVIRPSCFRANGPWYFIAQKPDESGLPHNTDIGDGAIGIRYGRWSTMADRRAVPIICR